jgi:hypothetical protein
VGGPDAVVAAQCLEFRQQGGPVDGFRHRVLTVVGTLVTMGRILVVQSRGTVSESSLRRARLPRPRCDLTSIWPPGRLGVCQSR